MSVISFVIVMFGSILTFVFSMETVRLLFEDKILEKEKELGSRKIESE